MSKSKLFGWVTDESLRRLSEGGNCRGSVPVHGRKSNVAKTPVYLSFDGSEKDAAWNRIFEATLPLTFECQGWKVGEEEVSSLEQRVWLAAQYADAAIKRIKTEPKP